MIVQEERNTLVSKMEVNILGKTQQAFTPNGVQTRRPFIFSGFFLHILFQSYIVFCLCYFCIPFFFFRLFFGFFGFFQSDFYFILILFFSVSIVHIFYPVHHDTL